MKEADKTAKDKQWLGKRGLVVDDDDITVINMTRHLKSIGLDIKVDRTGKDTLNILGKENYHIVLLDWELPDTNGLEILHNIRKQKDLIDIPVIMVTSHTGVDEAVASLNVGANDYIRKPLQVEEFVTRVSAQLKLAECSQKKISKTEAETIKAMLVTYNHQINNPLAIAYALVNKLEDRLGSEDEDVARLGNTLERIAHVVEEIRDLEWNREATVYSGSTRMYDLKDK